MLLHINLASTSSKLHQATKMTMISFRNYDNMMSHAPESRSLSAVPAHREIDGRGVVTQWWRKVESQWSRPRSRRPGLTVFKDAATKVTVQIGTDFRTFQALLVCDSDLCPESESATVTSSSLGSNRHGWRQNSLP